MDHFGLVQAVERLGQGVVITVARAADGGLDTCFLKSFGVADADILRPFVAVVDQGVAFGLTGVEGLLQRIEHEVRGHRAAHAPADDITGKHVDDEGDIHPALPG